MKLLKYLEITTDKPKNVCLKLIKDKHIKVNGIIITKEKTVIKEQNDEILLDDELLIYEEYIYLMMNKRSGLVCATNDNFQQTVFEDIKEFKNRELRLVGRLDKDTEGLLLITDDGNFIHHLTSPKHDIVKRYYVEFSGKYLDNVEDCFIKGIVLDDGEKCLPASIEKIDDNTFKISGSVSIFDLRKILEIEDIPEGDYDTLSGYLIEILGRIPSDTETPIIETPKVTYKIEEYEDKRISWVKACKNNVVEQEEKLDEEETEEK